MMFKKINLVAIMFICSNLISSQPSQYDLDNFSEEVSSIVEMPENKAVKISLLGRAKNCLCKSGNWFKTHPKTSTAILLGTALIGYSIFKIAKDKKENQEDTFAELDELENTDIENYGDEA